MRSRKANEESKGEMGKIWTGVLTTEKSISEVPIKYKTCVQFLTPVTQIQLPKPLWILIMSFLPPEHSFKLEMVCRHLYSICNPVCQFCSISGGDPNCYSDWKVLSGLYPKVLETYPDANCALMKSCIRQIICLEGFEAAIGKVRSGGCQKGRHILESNPNNPLYDVCTWCRKGVKKATLCPTHCSCGSFMCSVPAENPHFVHKCTYCLSPISLLEIILFPL